MLKQFAYQTFLQETNVSSDYLPYLLTKQDWNWIIDFDGKTELEKRYSCEIQSFYKTSCFEIVDFKPGVINKYSLEDIIETAKKTSLG